MKKERFIELLELESKDGREHMASLIDAGDWVMAWDGGNENHAHQGRYQKFEGNMYWVDGVDYDYIMPLPSGENPL